jgi:Immunoglobulin I-set domain
LKKTREFFGKIRRKTQRKEISIMKLSRTTRSFVKYLAVAATAFSLATPVKAHPYASAVINNSGTIQFILNEGGGTVNVVFEDGTTNVMGVLGKGAQSFVLGIHTSYSIYVTKTGNGTPSLISTDTAQFSIWNSPRGVDANKNPQIGYLFGRVYVGNSAVGGTSPNNKGQGLYALNADLSDSPLGHGANATGGGIFIAGSGASGPYRVRVAPDNTLLVGDFSTANAALWQYAPDLTSSNLVLGVIGENQGIAAGIHGDFFGTPLMTGSLANSNLVLWTADPGMGVPNSTLAPDLLLGPGTSRGSFNCLFRYDIGAGPLPWTNSPNYAYTLGLDSIAELRTEIDLGKDGKIIGGFGRANLSNPDVQILDPTGATVLWTSWNDTGGASDPWRGEANGTLGGTYCGVRVSSDGRFLASVDINNGITVANLTNGIPDDSSIFGIANASTTANSRGMCWDAADNIYVCSSGQGLLRIYSLGITTTCITSNDVTGTNGSFLLVLPPQSATVVASQPQASQNYINSIPAGTPIPGVFTISLSTNNLTTPVVVNFTRSGTAAYLTNYTINLGTDVNGVIISSNTVTFPAGVYPGVGNWSVNVQIIPTATPVSGPSLTVVLRVLGGANYLAGTPLTGTVSIANTGPQVLLLSAASSGTTMDRGVRNDYAEFVITRFGDTNGPGNSATSVSPTSYTVTNFTYLGTAAFPGDYTARAQRTDPSGNGVIATPTDGSPGIVIYPGNVSITNMVGNPVSHANLSQPPVNVTIVVSLTNAVTTTNATSSEGFAYSVSNNAVTLTELDNTIGPEVVLWSNPLTNSTDSTNWTLTFASTSFATNTTLPVVIPNYTNDFSSIAGGGTNDFNVEFGYPVANDSAYGISPSPAMAANGWTNALKMTVNKHNAAPAGVNLYPQGMIFQGNYALRFSMWLSLYDFAINNPVPGTTPWEYALFGINHHGTNCDWRVATPLTAGQGSGTTNADGVWFAINAGITAITPADFDAFTSPALPNAGVSADLVSNNGQSQSGVFKHPPFAASMAPFVGGEPVNQWVDVSVEVSAQTNVTLYMNRSAVLTSFSITNGGGYTSGTPMLGYLDPIGNQSDPSAFVYYSNVRVVELSPYIYAQPLSLIVTQGANVSFTSSAAFATAPITNIWFRGNTNPVVALQTNTANATNLTSTLSLNNVQTGTNYGAVFSDLAGSVTGLVTSLEVITGPASITTNTGATIRFAVTASGQSAPTSYQWKTNGVNLANGTHYAGVTTSTLTITNVQSSDAGTYSVAVVNAAGTVVPLATLTVNVPLPPTFSTVSLVGTNVVLSFSSPNAYDTTTSFILQSSILVQGPYTNTPATFTGSSGAFQVTAPQTGGNRFYRLLHI